MQANIIKQQKREKIPFGEYAPISLQRKQEEKARQVGRSNARMIKHYFQGE